MNEGKKSSRSDNLVTGVIIHQDNGLCRNVGVKPENIIQDW